MQSTALPAMGFLPSVSQEESDLLEEFRTKCAEVLSFHPTLLSIFLNEIAHAIIYAHDVFFLLQKKIS